MHKIKWKKPENIERDKKIPRKFAVGGNYPSSCNCVHWKKVSIHHMAKSKYCFLEKIVWENMCSWQRSKLYENGGVNEREMENGVDGRENGAVKLKQNYCFKLL